MDVVAERVLAGPADHRGPPAVTRRRDRDVGRTAAEVLAEALDVPKRPPDLQRIDVNPDAAHGQTRGVPARSPVLLLDGVDDVGPDALRLDPDGAPWPARGPQWPARFLKRFNTVSIRDQRHLSRGRRRRVTWIRGTRPVLPGRWTQPSPPQAAAPGSPMWPPGRGFPGVGVARAPEPARPERGDPGPGAEAARELGYRADRTASLLARAAQSSSRRADGRAEHLPRRAAADIDARHQAGLRPGAQRRATPARNERRAAEILLDFRCEALILLGRRTRPTGLVPLASSFPSS